MDRDMYAKIIAKLKQADGVISELQEAIGSLESGVLKSVEYTIAENTYTAGTNVRENVELQTGETSVAKRVCATPKTDKDFALLVMGDGRIGVIPFASKTSTIDIIIWYME